jgi:hypothetical protein
VNKLLFAIFCTEPNIPESINDNYTHRKLLSVENLNQRRCHASDRTAAYHSVDECMTHRKKPGSKYSFGIRHLLLIFEGG